MATSRARGRMMGSLVVLGLSLSPPTVSAGEGEGERLPGSASGSGAGSGGIAFADRIASGLTGGPIAWDRLWDPETRTQQRRVLDARVHSLFDWSDVEVVPESIVVLGEGAILGTVQVRGAAMWREKAWGVAAAFWTQQTDEQFESNAVVRRERWLGRPDGTHMASRELLSPVAITTADVSVSVYPGQDAMLLECSYHLRSLIDGTRNVRFLLDRRVHVYDFRVDGERCEVVRGNELGSLGLEGFSPELESSFRLPRALSEGEEAVVRFRLRSPIVHMRGTGWVTSLPVREGAFRERVWLPVFDRTGRDAGDTEIRLTVAWPEDAFEAVALAADEDDVVQESKDGKRLEESRAKLETRGNVASLDFVLLAGGSTLADLPGVTRAELDGAHPVSGAPVMRFSRVHVGEEARTRGALFAPLLDVSQSSQDLATELQDLIPMDDDMLDELFDDSSQDAERGADDRQAE